jgi:hypothetical protein
MAGRQDMVRAGALRGSIAALYRDNEDLRSCGEPLEKEKD